MIAVTYGSTSLVYQQISTEVSVDCSVQVFF